MHCRAFPSRLLHAHSESNVGPELSHAKPHKRQEASAVPKAKPLGNEKGHSPTNRSNISQLAQYYQQAADEEQQAAGSLSSPNPSSSKLCISCEESHVYCCHILTCQEEVAAHSATAASLVLDSHRAIFCS